MSALELRHITKNFGSVETLKGIDITLESGEFLILLGSSGCGKSTLLNIIAGLAEATSGAVVISGRDVSKVHPKDRDIAMVFQSYALYPNMSVARNIGFGLEMRQVDKDTRDRAVAEAARILQIEPLLDRRPSELSGGQRQRVAIGRALVRNPKIFLFDEPLSNLDAKLRTEMRTELKRLHQALKATVVYVTHDQIEAMTLASRIAVMRNGQIEQLGTPEEIYNQPATLYVAGFVGSTQMNLLDATVAEGKVTLDGTETSLALPQGQMIRPGPAILGFRPEDADIAGEGEAVTLAVVADVVELTGPDVVLTALCGTHRIRATLPPRARPQQGDALTLKVPGTALHFFDPATGRRL
nr:sn-glycerol-3-phosphate ABC transporter ATP-binding protein UgpC [uncultured Gellertiella sp.]